MHKLLKLQLEKSGLSKAQMADMQDLIELIMQAYNGYDNDLSLLDNVLDQSTGELVEVNQDLEENVEGLTDEFEKTEEQLERVVNHVPGVIFETDGVGNFKFLNPSWELLSGYTVEETLGKHYSEFLKGFNSVSEVEIAKIGCDVSKDFKSVVSITTKDGIKKWIEINYKTIENLNEDLPGVIGSLVDVTKLKETELELIKTQKAMRKAIAAKEDFLSTMSHEIRTPLNGVIGISNVLVMDDHLESQKENLKVLKYSSEHLLALINDILDYNKMEGGNIEFENTDFNFKALVKSIKKTFKFQAGEKGVDFTVDIDYKIPKYLKGDKTRLSQVLNNLLSNAIKFTHEGEINLVVENVSENDKAVTLLFEVQDTGIGISLDKLDRIFEKFKQADSSISSMYGGTGLGLAICKKLLLMQNSDLKVKSVPDIGSKFYFVLTFDKSVQNVDGSFQALPMQVVSEDIKGIRVLVAEDNRINQIVISKYLEKWDIIYDVVDNGKEAVDKYNKYHYDLILMDLQMPKMNGYEASKKILKIAEVKGQKISIVALTASAQLDVKFKAEKTGMTGFVTKPFKSADLYNTIVDQLKGVKQFSHLN